VRDLTKYIESIFKTSNHYTLIMETPYVITYENGVNVITFHVDYKNDDFIFEICNSVYRVGLKIICDRLLKHLPKGSYIYKLNEINIPISLIIKKYEKV
jgi:hypothetical protein